MMKDFKISNKGTATLFENKWLERLTRTTFIFPVLFYYCISLFFIVFTFFTAELNPVHMAWLLPAGLVFFSFIEYLIHRFAFHFNADTERKKLIQYKIHGVHHEFPRDKERLAMPPVMSILLALIFYALFYFTLGVFSGYFFAGFIAGYSTYLVIHYVIHARRPPKNFLRILWTHHSLHHYASVNSAFAVSFPLWDYLFRTLPKYAGEKKR